jgi:hypothetical protein
MRLISAAPGKFVVEPWKPIAVPQKCLALAEQATDLNYVADHASPELTD